MERNKMQDGRREKTGRGAERKGEKGRCFDIKSEVLKCGEHNPEGEK